MSQVTGGLLRSSIPLTAVVTLTMVAGCDRGARQGMPAISPRAGVDVATKAYGDCVATAARSLPVSDGTPGGIADRAIASCGPVRAALMPKVRDFYRAAHAKATAGLAANVAEASVATLEDDIRTRAVIAIVQRQNKARDNIK